MEELKNRWLKILSVSGKDIKILALIYWENNDVF